MAAKRWLGRAGAVAQVDTVTIATGSGWAPGDTVTLTINGKDLVITLQTTTLADIATTIKEAWQNDTLTADTSATFIPADGGQSFVEHAELTATVATTVVTLTHDTAGVPFTLTAATDGTGDITAATATAATGPNHWDNADNWDAGAAPIAGDDVYIDNSDVSILYALDQSAVDLSTIWIRQNYTGEIGLPKTNPAGYVEYREDYLRIGAAGINIGRGPGAGSGRIKLDTVAFDTVLTVVNTGAPAEFGLEAVLWKGTNVANAVEVVEGSLGVAPFGGEDAKIATLNNASGTVHVYQAASQLTNLLNSAGNVTLESNTNLTTITNNGGSVSVNDQTTATTLTVNGGTVYLRNKGNPAIGTCVVGGPRGAILDASQDTTGALSATNRVITTMTLNAGGQIVDPTRTITYTNDIAIGTDVESISAS